MEPQFSMAELEAYLDETLCPQRTAQIEASLRDSDALGEQLATIVGRHDAGMHSLGGIWRRHRLSCPTRQQLGSFLLDVLEAGEADYVRFHLHTIGCRVCLASLADLQEQHAATNQPEITTRRQKYFQSSAGYLSRD